MPTWIVSGATPLITRLFCEADLCAKHSNTLPFYPTTTASWAVILHVVASWWRHQMEKFAALLALCAGNSPINGEFPAQRPVTRSFYVPFDLRLDKRLSKQSLGWWFETPSRSLWRHRNVVWMKYIYVWHTNHCCLMDKLSRAVQSTAPWRAAMDCPLATGKSVFVCNVSMCAKTTMRISY